MKQKGNSMQMRKSLLIGMVIASLWAATGFVQSVWGQERAYAGRGGMLLRLVFKVATPDQRDQVKKILADHRGTLRDSRSTLQMNREALTDALLTNTGDLPKLLQNVNDAQASLAQERLDIIVAVLNILTLEQRSKVVELKGQLRSLHDGIHSVLSGSDQQ